MMMLLKDDGGGGADIASNYRHRVSSETEKAKGKKEAIYMEDSSLSKSKLCKQHSRGVSMKTNRIAQALVWGKQLIKLRVNNFGSNQMIAFLQKHYKMFAPERTDI